MNTLSRYGIGGIVIPDHESGWVKASDFPALLDRCTHDLGITYIDSAKAYELSERLIGEWLAQQSAELRSRLIIGTKIGTRGTPSKKLDRESILTSARNARELIGALDLFWTHSPDPATPLSEQIAGLNDVVETGVTKAYGVSNVTAAQLEEILNLKDMRMPFAVQNEYSLVARSSQRAVLALCKQNGLKFFAFSPLASGVLAGRYTWNQPMPEDSRWAGWSKSRPLPDYWTEKTFAALAELAKLAQDKQCSMAALALAWTAQKGEVDVTLLGPRTVKQLEASEEAMRLVLTPRDIEEIQSLFNQDN